MSLELHRPPSLPANRNVGIGCIGAGFIMADCHLGAYRHHGLNPVAISSRTLNNAQSVAERHEIGVASDTYQDVITHPEVSMCRNNSRFNSSSLSFSLNDST